MCGGGQNYFLENIKKINYIDIKYIYPGGEIDKSKEIYDKYIILNSIEEIKKIKLPFVLIARGLYKDVERISGELRKNGIPYDYMGNYISGLIKINYLEAMHASEYIDMFNNRIVLDSEGKSIGLLNFSRMSTSINNYLKIGKIVCKRPSTIAMIGEKGICEIGNGTTIEQVEIIINSLGKVYIGKDCLFSYGISIMQTDHHHIFDQNTYKRINISKDIQIGNHVWVGRDVELLAGASIGNNSVIGARAVTSSKFGNNVVIAGNPAKIIRQNIIWAEDPIRRRSIDSFENAVDQRGLEY